MDLNEFVIRSAKLYGLEGKLTNRRTEAAVNVKRAICSILLEQGVPRKRIAEVLHIDRSSTHHLHDNIPYLPETYYSTKRTLQKLYVEMLIDSHEEDIRSYVRVLESVKSRLDNVSTINVLHDERTINEEKKEIAKAAISFALERLNMKTDFLTETLSNEFEKQL